MSGQPSTLFIHLRLILLIPVLAFHLSYALDRPQCVEMTIPLCHGLGYNKTYSPNRFFHEDQKEAAAEVHQFWPLVSIKCSPVFKFFLCSLYAPVCDEHFGHDLVPCRSVCEQSKRGCLSYMKQYGFKWPDKMKCELFPNKKENPLCMYKEEDNSSSSNPTGTYHSSRNKNNPPTVTIMSRNKIHKTNSHKDSTETPFINALYNSSNCHCECVEPFRRVEPRLKRNIGDVNNCALPCRASLFNKAQKDFAKVWITLWSSLCFLSTFLTMATFFLNTARFRYPERPVIFLSGCYFLMSFGYILRLIAGEESVICDDNDLITYNTTSPALCTIVFLLIYFGCMASALWWVILSFTWFLSAGLKWSNEAIANVSQYFHIVAWIIPSLQTILVLAMSKIDGDSLSGICSVGNQSKDSLVAFIIVPLGIFLTIGSVFLLTGFVSLFRIRKTMRSDGNNTNKLEKLMVRIGVFSVLYTVPATVTIGCYFYELSNRPKWENWINCSRSPCARPKKLKPEFSLFVVKYFMSLVVGISTGFWICSMKTLESWRNMIRRLFRVCFSKRTKLQESPEQVALRADKSKSFVWWSI